MKLSVGKLDEDLADEILNWKYDRPFDFYNNEETAEAKRELLDGSYSALRDGSGELVGFFCIGASARVPAGNQFDVYPEGFVDMGLGMHPKLVGKGHGFAFCSFIIGHIEGKHTGTPIRLTVATFNRRAIHLYEKLGFVSVDEFRTDASRYMTMVRKNA